MKLLLILLIVLLFSPFIAQAFVQNCGYYSTYTDKLFCVIDNVSVVLYILAGGIALVVIIWGGISYMTAGGNEDQIKKAKKVIFNGLIGAAIVFCAGFVLELLAEFLAPLYFTS